MGWGLGKCCNTDRHTGEDREPGTTSRLCLSFVSWLLTFFYLARLSWPCTDLPTRPYQPVPQVLQTLQVLVVVELRGLEHTRYTHSRRSFIFGLLFRLCLLFFNVQLGIISREFLERNKEIS